MKLGTAKHHQKYVDKMDSLELPGCFGMTELGHGSNVMVRLAHVRMMHAVSQVTSKATCQGSFRVVPLVLAGYRNAGNVRRQHPAVCDQNTAKRGQQVLDWRCGSAWEDLHGVCAADGGRQMAGAARVCRPPAQRCRCSSRRLFICCIQWISRLECTYSKCCCITMLDTDMQAANVMCL
jgi:hypothetical protein